MKVLVTGGAGFIGSHLVEHFEKRAEVVVLDDLRTGHRHNLEGRSCRLVEGSISEPELVARCMEGVDYVFHLAAMVSVPESMAQPLATAEINVRGLLHVLEAARAGGVRKLIFASSAAVYGENPADPKVETMPPDPRSPYAITKLDGEFYCDLYTREGWLPTACLRFFNVFGPRQDPHSAYAAAIPRFLEHARAGTPLTIFGDGGQTRDFIYVKDIVGAMAFLAEAEGIHGVFNAGYGSSISILELARHLVRLAGSPSEIVFAPTRPGDLRHSSANPSRLLAAGWKPSFDLASGLRDLLSQSS
jgi:UDP-glucose 4-epimerase